MPKCNVHPWCVERCVPDLKKSLASATHYRSKFAVSAEEFQQSVGENDIAFTHCSDIGQVFALQAKVYRQKLLGTRTLMLHFPSREDRQKKPGILSQSTLWICAEHGGKPC